MVHVHVYVLLQGIKYLCMKCNISLFGFQGPAYSVQTIGLEKYVRAAGLHHELIAVYEFEVVFTASYAIWMHFFATTNQTNDISFKVGEGDWNVWQPPHKSSHALWTQFFYQVYFLFIYVSPFICGKRC